jgi:hypothetical protein
VRVVGTATANNNTSPKTATATCPVGTKAIGGGGLISGVSAGITTSYPSSDTVWTVTGEKLSGNPSWSLQAFVICATVA